MASEWIDRTLEELAAPIDRPFAMGPFGSNIRSENYRTSGIPVIRGLNLADVGGPAFIDSNFVFLSADKADELSSSNAYPGDLIFVAQGTVGRVGLVPRRGTHERYVLSQNLMKATVAPEMVDPEFVFYYFRSQAGQHEILSRANPTGVPCISRPLSSLRTFRVPLPSLREQRAIARILGTLDDKIELNRQMNETLEAMARALFKSWFVDFEPVRAKAEGRDPGLPKDIANLFSNRLIGSELGEIPEGWVLEDLGSVTTYLNRGISPSYVEQGGVLVLNQKCIRDGHVDTSKGRRHDPEAREVGGRTLKPGDVLVNSTGVGTLGRVGQMLTVDADTIVDSHITIIRAREQVISSNYLGINLCGRADEIETLGEGSTGQTELSRARLADLSVLIPPRRVIAAFDRLTASLRERAARSEREAITLGALRDALLPKLICGALRVKDVNRFIAPAV